MEKLLDSKTAVVTGASSGIGRCIAELFALHGARVVLVARREALLREVAEGIRSRGGECLVVVADVTVPENCGRVFSEAKAVFGSIDILVNNAGAGDYHTQALRCTDEFWSEIIALNQTAVFRFCREALKYMTEQGTGVIVNNSSMAGVYGNAGVAYSSSKAAVISMTKNIATQYAGTGIRCNAVCPGPTDVIGMFDPAKEHLFDKELMEITKRHMDSTIPMIKPEEQAEVFLFLASDKSSCITGQAIITDAGVKL